MELTKQWIHTNTIKPGSTLQITLDDDFNVPDNRDDVEKITVTRGEIELTETEGLTDKIRLHGLCHFHVLYATNLEEHPVSSFDGTIPFEETINCDGILPSDTIKVKAFLEDLNITIINSRKLSIRCLVNLHANVSESQNLEAATNLEASTPLKGHTAAPAATIETLHNNLDMTTLVINKKDIYRLRQELTIPSNKPNIYEILWNSTGLRNPEIKLADGKLNLRGDLAVFVLYTSEDENAPLQFLEMEVPFKGELPCENCMEGMIDSIEMRITTAQFAIKPDTDGEQRILELECTLELDIKIYEEEHLKLLWDAYSPNTELALTKTPFLYSKLIMKNNAKTRISQRVKRDSSKDSIMQLCHTDGQVKIDETTLTQDGLSVEGVLSVDVLYISTDDSHPVNSSSFLLPFQYLIELDGIQDNSSFELTANLEQLSVSMPDSNELEIKATIGLCAIAFDTHKAYAIENAEEAAPDRKKMQALPGMVGYIVKENDTLWNIAKKYYTTMDNILACNHLEGNHIHAGDKIIIVK